jgi:hypothetical protein
MTPSRCFLVCTFIAGTTALAAANAQLPLPQAPSAAEIALAAKCKAASFKRRPAGQMATTMRDVEIKLCIQSGGVLH